MVDLNGLSGNLKTPSNPLLCHFFVLSVYGFTSSDLELMDFDVGFRLCWTGVEENGLWVGRRFSGRVSVLDQNDDSVVD